MPALEAWEKVWVERDEAGSWDPIHGDQPCVDCHDGDATATRKDVAHEGLIVDPSADPVAACGDCHAEAEASMTSIHRTLSGERTMISARMGHEMSGHVEAGFQVACNGCHATCGQCHVSRPDSVEGGFVDGHRFLKTPSMPDQCTACHGSRIGEEFRGAHRDQIDGYQADVHYLAGMRCEACHDAREMHEGSGPHRYAVAEAPTCRDCHTEVLWTNTWHEAHSEDLSCHVCHAQDYKNCDSCHVGQGIARPSTLGFKVGRNPLPERGELYTTLRHIPVAPETYGAWGVPLLAGYDVLPSWKTATPHNIQRWTDRTTTLEGQACGTPCHLTPATTEGWFLREADLSEHPDEAESNRALVVPDGPPSTWD